MKAVLKVVLFVLVVYAGFFLSVAWVGGGGLVGGMLLNAQTVKTTPMGPTQKLKPGQTYTLTNPTDGTQFNFTILSGTMTSPPPGFVHYIPPGKESWFECRTPARLIDDGCADGTVIHYQNLATGEKMDQLVTRIKLPDGRPWFKITPLPTPQSRLELKWSANAYASIGDSFNIGSLNITVIDITYNPGGTYTATLDVNGALVVTEGEIT